MGLGCYAAAGRCHNVARKRRDVVLRPCRALSRIFFATEGLHPSLIYFALSGLPGVWLFSTHMLHPVLVYYALSGLYGVLVAYTGLTVC